MLKNWTITERAPSEWEVRHINGENVHLCRSPESAAALWWALGSATL